MNNIIICNYIISNYNQKVTICKYDAITVTITGTKVHTNVTVTNYKQSISCVIDLKNNSKTIQSTGLDNPDR